MPYCRLCPSSSIQCLRLKLLIWYAVNCARYLVLCICLSIYPSVSFPSGALVSQLLDLGLDFLSFDISSSRAKAESSDEDDSTHVLPSTETQRWGFVSALAFACAPLLVPFRVHLYLDAVCVCACMIAWLSSRMFLLVSVADSEIM